MNATLNFSQYLARVNFALDNNIPVIIKSGPGEGKTQTCKQIADDRKAKTVIACTCPKRKKALEKKGFKCFLVINAVNKNPSHVNGLPHMTEEGASFAFYDFMRIDF